MMRRRKKNMIVRQRKKRRIAMVDLLLTRPKLTLMLKKTRNGKRVQSLLVLSEMMMNLDPLREKLRDEDVATISGSKIKNKSFF
jgi:hypothetical protein